MTASDELARALVVMAAAGGSAPCGEYGERDLWTSDHIDDRVIAVGRCQACVVLAACAAAADEAGEQWHVWGGKDRTRIGQKRKASR